MEWDVIFVVGAGSYELFLILGGMVGVGRSSSIDVVL